MLYRFVDQRHVFVCCRLKSAELTGELTSSCSPQIWGTCLGHQLLQILSTNTTFDELLIETDAVVSRLLLFVVTSDILFYFKRILILAML